MDLLKFQLQVYIRSKHDDNHSKNDGHPNQKYAIGDCDGNQIDRLKCD